MIVYIVQTTEGRHYRVQEDKATLYDNEKEVLQLVADVAANRKADTKIEKIYKMDMVYGKTTQLKPELVGYELKLKELEE